MADDSLLVQLATRVFPNTNDYGYALNTNGIYENQTFEFKMLTEGGGNKERERGKNWCNDASIIYELPGKKEGIMSIFIWTRGRLARSNKELLKFYIRAVLDKDPSYSRISSAIVRQHGTQYEIGEYTGYYSLEIWLTLPLK